MQSDDPRKWPPIFTAVAALQAIADLPTGANEDIERGREDAYRAVERLFPSPPEIEGRTATPNHEARRDGVRVTDEMVKRAAVEMAAALESPHPDPDAWIEYEGVARAALEAALPPLGDGRAEIVEACARVADALAERQAETNRKHPDHVKAYPSWEAYVDKYREVAAAIRSLSNPGGSL